MPLNRSRMYDDASFQFPIKQRHKNGVFLNRAKPVTSKALPEDEFVRFRGELASGKDGLLFAVLATVQYYQALRISEAAALHWEDVYLDWRAPKNSRLKITRSICWLRKKGLPSFVKVGFKNADANRGIKEQPLFPEAFDALLKLYRADTKGLVFLKEERTCRTGSSRTSTIGLSRARGSRTGGLTS